MPQCAPTPFVSQTELLIELSHSLSSTFSLPEGTLPSPHKARQELQAESPLLEHDLFGTYNPMAPTGSWGWG